MHEELKRAVQVLKSGGIVVFPTDTVYGIGCRIDNKKAVERLFKIRNRPPNQATPVLVSSKEQAKDYFVSITKKMKDLMDKYWPGGLTIVYSCQKDKTPFLVRGGGETIGLRMPDYPLLLEIINKVGVPILGPSANFHRKQTPHSYDDLDREFVSLVDYVIKGNVPGKTASTVIDCRTSPITILRQGEIYLDEKDFDN